jgi:hypothetical protein
LPMAPLLWGQGQGHEGGGRGAPGKMSNGAAHRGGGAMVGWQRDINAMAVGGEGRSDGGRRCSEVHLRLRESEGAIGSELNRRGRGEGARWQLSPRREDDGGGAAKFLVRVGAPTVGVDEKATGGGEGGDGLLRVPSACAERRKWREGASGLVSA